MDVTLVTVGLFASDVHFFLLSSEQELIQLEEFALGFCEER